MEHGSAAMLPQAPTDAPQCLVDFGAHHARELLLVFEAVNGGLLGARGDFWQFAAFCYDHTF